MGPRDRIVRRFGAVNLREERGGAPDVRAAAASLGGAKLASIDFDDEEDDLDESSVGERGTDLRRRVRLGVGVGARRVVLSSPFAKRFSRDRSDASSSHRHSRSRSNTPAPPSASNAGLEIEDAAYRTPRDIKKHAHASDERLSAEFLRTLPKSARETEEAYQRWSRLKPEDAVEAPSDVGRYARSSTRRACRRRRRRPAASPPPPRAARRAVRHRRARRPRGGQRGGERGRGADKAVRRRPPRLEAPRAEPRTRPPGSRPRTAQRHRGWASSSSSPSFSFVIDAREPGRRRGARLLRPAGSPVRPRTRARRDSGDSNLRGTTRARGRPPAASLLDPFPAGDAGRRRRALRVGHHGDGCSLSGDVSLESRGARRDGFGVERARRSRAWANGAKRAAEDAARARARVRRVRQTRGRIRRRRGEERGRA